jgi:transcriptional regulator with XRE-family HTH domain
MEKQTIIQQIQPQCDNLYKNIKDAAMTQHRTHREIVEHTGVPRSTVAKFLSGALASPSVFYIAALCKYLNLSMDGLFDTEPQSEREAGENADLQAKLNSAEQQIKHLNEKCGMLEAGIRERKPVIYGLAGLCIFLSVALCGYIALDISDMEHGFFTENGLSVMGGVLCIFLVSVVLALLHFAAKAKRKKDNEKDNLI